jgi:hypothetical protein
MGLSSIPSATRFSERQWGLERGPPSLVFTIEDLLGRKQRLRSRKNREYGRREPSRLPRGTLYPQKFALPSPTSCGRSVGLVRSRTHATEFSLVVVNEELGIGGALIMKDVK